MVSGKTIRTGSGWARPRPDGAAGLIMLELVVALGVLASALLPVSYAVMQERRALRALYFRAVALETIDGEWEILRSGECRAFGEGLHPYPVRHPAAAQLPAGTFQLRREGHAMRLEWLPRGPWQGGPVVREGRCW